MFHIKHTECISPNLTTREWFLPFGLIRGVGCLGELLRGGGEPLLGALQVLLEQLDATVERGDLALGLKVEKGGRMLMRSLLWVPILQFSYRL